MTRLLITGFGPFPGAPSNPTMRIATRLGRARGSRLATVQRIVRLLPTTWAMLDTLPRDIGQLAPDAVLMFGLAGRRRTVTPEARALNQAGPLRTDAAGRRPQGRQLAAGGPSIRTGGIDATRLTAALRRQGLPAAVSRNAGDYLCNALFYHVAGLGIPCIFIHVPRPARATLPRGRLKHPRPSMTDLHRAADIVLDALLLQARR